ncbi:hypothetical protein [Rhodovulum adriaticum]|uniref:Uncharacterized protein n=2 Tax=Rhodovulum adriaticum TaxID=35804 RepID=A0A4R2NUW9_RHOAD|nr:hypothetical protein [Rhodovulum adriaticum]MBK1637150.1 hypothetical protein [Rhodovulum adriaticum]TCP25361.1 hypothetical protein EV656_103110 [Rhodovulum adriaticum]
MQRDLDEVLASQEVMMRRDGLDPDAIGRDVLHRLFQEEVIRFLRWAEAQRNIALLRLDYGQVVADPAQAAQALDEFLGGGLDRGAMAGAVESTLYRNRA